MAHTAALGQLIQQLDSDTSLQDAFRTNPSNALEPFDVTSHEHDAVVTRDLDDLVALGVASSIEELPEVLRGTREEGPHYNVPEHLRDRLDWIRRRIPHLMHPRPRVPDEGPPPPPEPPDPGPGPDPTPGG